MIQASTAVLLCWDIVTNVRSCYHFIGRDHPVNTLQPLQSCVDMDNRLNLFNGEFLAGRSSHLKNLVSVLFKAQIDYLSQGELRAGGVKGAVELFADLLPVSERKLVKLSINCFVSTFYWILSIWYIFLSKSILGWSVHPTQDGSYSCTSLSVLLVIQTHTELYRLIILFNYQVIK